MTDYYNTYKDLLRLDKAKESNDYFLTNNKEIILDQFSDSLLTKTVLINNAEYDVMFKQGKKNEDKKIIFKPDTKINIGSVVIIGEETCLTVDFLGEGIYEIYPSATLKQCNTSLLLSGEITRTQTGTNDFGQPIYGDIYGEPIEVPCIVETSITMLNETQKAINLPEGKVQITIPYTIHEELKVGSEITLYDEQYKITGVDRTKIGLMTIHAELVVV